jgi:hypothetical protein
MLIAQEKEKVEEEVDEIKSAKDMAPPPKEDQEAAPAAGESAPPVDKLKVKTKTKEGTQKTKQKGAAPQ